MREAALLPVLLAWLACAVRAAHAADYPWYEQITRQDSVVSGCEALGLSRTPPPVEQLDHLLVDRNHRLLYCYVPKVACTNWKRVLMVLTGRSNATDLSTIQASLVHENRSLPRLSQLDPREALHSLHTYTRFIMVRHPFERLLSAYRNKLEDHYSSAKYFQARIGRYIVRKYRPNASADALARGDDVSFKEFVQYLITEGFGNDTVNEHWQPIHQLCHPCSLNYTFVGKYERLNEDADVVLRMIGAANVSFPQGRPSSTYHRLKGYFSQLSLPEIEQLYHLYKTDFRLFGYNLEDILGYDIG